MGYPSWQAFHNEYKHHAALVNDIYQTLLVNDDAGSNSEEFTGIWLQIDEQVILH